MTVCCLQWQACALRLAEMASPLGHDNHQKVRCNARQAARVLAQYLRVCNIGYAQHAGCGGAARSLRGTAGGSGARHLSAQRSGGAPVPVCQLRQLDRLGLIQHLPAHVTLVDKRPKSRRHDAWDLWVPVQTDAHINTVQDMTA